MLVALAVALVPAFIFAPGPLAASMSGGGFGDQRILSDSLSESFVDYWSSGDRDFSPDLERVVDYWLHYHVVKAVIAATLLAVLTTLGVLLWRAFLRAGEFAAGGRTALASAGVVVTALALFSLAAVMANIQGAIAPFSSLLSMLPMYAAHGELADTLDQVRQRLADYPNSGDRTPPAIEVMVSDFSRYHAVMAVAATMVAAVLVGMSVVSWKRFARTGASDRRTRRVFRSFGLLSALLSSAVIVVAGANLTTTADPAPALLAFFKGGW
ncbi:hypothetical protein OG978_07060 [Streptomyces sp. NBC_01591]|uniref:hypothetical protein n=1 Tax=Streptomyces sp. NBC_01591 TaxID=2975888 RepID=UPI002DD9D444|nr:hypothetical protein [Streptomyces sp. NBC_01591]WSD67163.1 hypothetical protein OG978_07060 [Streptomyces sp. NBC_01591]